MTAACSLVSSSPTLEVRQQLDDVYAMVLGGHASADDILETLTQALESARRDTDPDIWTQQARALVASHPIVHLVHQEPFTRRCFYKPRGYAGDARMLDYVYGQADDDDSTELGQRLLAAAIERPAPRAVRNRRDVLAGLIDAAAARTERPRVLAIASGHLREAARSAALREKRVGEIVAFDQDARSLARVAADCAGLPVTPRQGHVRDLIVGRRNRAMGTFDLVYAAGLYDYLTDEAAIRLTRTLFGLLRPGGHLLFANFLPGIPDRGYMETFMDWHLIYRSLAQMESLLSATPQALVARSRSFSDSTANIGFIEATRSAQ